MKQNANMKYTRFKSLICFPSLHFYSLLYRVLHLATCFVRVIRKNIQAYSKSLHLADALNHTQNLNHFFAASCENMDFTCMSRDISVKSCHSHASNGRARNEQKEKSIRIFFCIDTQAATFDSTNIQQLHIFVYACV